MNFDKKFLNSLAALGVASVGFSTEALAQRTAYEKETRPYTVIGPEYSRAVASGDVKSFLDRLNTAAFCPEVHSRGILYCLRKEGAVEEIVNGLAQGGYPPQLIEALRTDLERFRDHMPNHDSVKPDVKVASDAVLWTMLGRHRVGNREGQVQVVGKGDAEVALHTPVVRGKTGRVEYPGWRVSTQETTVNGRRALVTVIIMQECGNPTVVVEYLPDHSTRSFEGERCPTDPTILLKQMPGRNERAVLERIFVYQKDAPSVSQSEIPSDCYVPSISCPRNNCESRPEKMAKEAVARHLGINPNKLATFEVEPESLLHRGSADRELSVPSFVHEEGKDGSSRGYRAIRGNVFSVLCVKFNSVDGTRMGMGLVVPPSYLDNPEQQYVQEMSVDDVIQTDAWTPKPIK